MLLLDHLMAEQDCPGVIAAETNQGGEMVRDVITNAAEKLTTRSLSTEEVRFVGKITLEKFYEQDPDDGTWRRRSKAVTIKDNHASKSKRARAEPVAQLYDERAIHHVGAFDALEDEWCTWNAEEGGESPNLIDAEVWAMVELKVVRLAQEAAPVAVTRSVDRRSASVLQGFNEDAPMLLDATGRPYRRSDQSALALSPPPSPGGAAGASPAWSKRAPFAACSMCSGRCPRPTN